MSETARLCSTHMTRETMAQKLDSTYLTVSSDSEMQVRALCHEAIEQSYRAVCIRPEWLPIARDILVGSSVGLATVIAFPQTRSTIKAQKNSSTFGVETIVAKCHAIDDALTQGATELDVVVNTAAYHNTRPSMAYQVYEECRQLLRAVDGRLLKLIFECDLVSVEQQHVAFDAALQAGVTCLKNATGFLEDGVGASPDLLDRMTMHAKRAPQSTLVKASGGIRTTERALALTQAGADIIGSSAAKIICDGLN